MKKSACLLALSLALSGCGEFSEYEHYNSEEPVEGVQTALVTPVFQVSGLEALPQDLILERLGLSISEIRLEPLGDEASGLAYATSRSFELVFDLAAGEDSVSRSSVEVPKTGEFLISVRLEPTTESANFLTGPYQGASLGLEGMVRMAGYTEAADDYDEEGDGKPLPLPFKRYFFEGGETPGDDDDPEDGDGKPLPLPFARSISQELEEESSFWAPFRYRSHQVIYFTFARVELVPGEQILTFDFDLSEWAKSVSAPIAEAVLVSRSEGEDFAQGAVVDVSRDLNGPDSHYILPETLLSSGSVTNTPVMP